ncbi:endonuclease V [Halobellus salinus]|uniref:Endonuclease V n=1 Tax=Halobellus salinus TaxID=931585 RepID=A0A830ETX5_9EURY|nr:endonuclease V [Halobellus salinus]GGJ09504.1 endonuclease V [Halobellus salinus]SMP27505.1 Endonuclease V [Halobellus salinus]
MHPVRPEFVPDPDPDPDTTRERMETLQSDVAAAATWTDAFEFVPESVGAVDRTLSTPDSDPPLVAGVDQAFLDDRAVSVVVVSRGGTVVERVHAVTDVAIPYIPGLLAFREGGPILSAFAELGCDPDLAVFDGSGRIHFRQAGLATHIGVTLDVPSVGVAKGLLCGTPDEGVDGREEGWRTPIRADADVTNADPGTAIGHALQSRQYDSTRKINPLYVSPGHRVGVGTATDLVERLCAGYKLPEPTRRADAYADDVKQEYV